ncbi:aminoglycoside phosphotransferase [Glycomyces buryatensis]|uniref:Aminoglycoside phosphotransferase n=1 Tax=Glycomyces buryatensis TaxID=2570927 RepID=A0A4S8PU74_9ACTN|nr:aminoglycoside phosphotransferase [Glycomyces buryatensis]THV33415.1 aminoglycoside phosphotransferase [Glycomyces buryatensis]
MLTDPRHSPIGTPTAWQALTHNAANEATGGIWRVSGSGGTAILKVATPPSESDGQWAASDDPRHWNYWKREYLAYSTGATTAYGEGTTISAPRLLAAGPRADGALELWLEDADGTPGQDWSVDRLADFAEQLGLAQARHVGTASQPWHSRQWLRQYAGRHDYRDIDWDAPKAAEHWPDELRSGLRSVWERRTDLFDLVESLPQTLCHLDVWPMNLATRGDEPVLLDWSFFGSGAIGEDIANLIADTFLDGLQPVGLLPEVESALTDAYLAGLAAGGYRDEAATRKAIAASGAAKYAWLAPMMLSRLASGQSTGSVSYDTDSGDDAVLARRRPIFEMITAWARTALDT